MSSSQVARIESLDEFRGYTVAAMFLVNFLGSYYLVTEALPNLKHHNTYCSFADTVMSQFFFAVGFGFRLGFVRRVEVDGVPEALKRVVKRVAGLLLVALIVHGLDVKYESWSALQEAGVWGFLSTAFQRNYFQTLTHIALATLWVTPVIGLSVRWRIGFLLMTIVLHVVISANGYYAWVVGRPCIDGGQLGFMSWVVCLLAGSFVYDIIASSQRDFQEEGKRVSAEEGGKRFQVQEIVKKLFWLGAVMMVAGYALSCVNRVAFPNSIAHWSSWRDVLVEPPFVAPSQPINMWTMSQRACSVSYTLFSGGYCVWVYGLFYLLVDIGKWRCGVFRTLGVNALAGYILHDWVNAALRPFWPRDCAIWYAVLGFVISFFLCYLILRFFERQKIFFKV
jgi:hypothetical protein